MTCPRPSDRLPNGPLVYTAEGDTWLRDERGEVTRLTSGDSVDTWPAWPPGGSQLAYASYAGGPCELMIVDADGSDPRAVATGLSASPGHVR